MAILGIYDGHNAGAALISERTGHVLAAVEEERFSRIKNHDSRGSLPGPLHSVAYCLSKADGPVSRLAIGLEEPQALQRRATNNFLSDVHAGQHQRLDRAAQLGVDYHQLLTMPFETQSARVQKCLTTAQAAGLNTENLQIHYASHHQSHAAGAYLLAPITTDALVLTLDGKGDDLSGSVSIGSAHNIRPILELSTLESLGHLYSAFTVATGFRPQRDEGKLMALAASGTVHEGLQNWLKSQYALDRQSGALISMLNAGLVLGPFPDRIPSGHNDLVRDRIRGIDITDAAATVQQFLEEIVCSLVSFHLQKTGLTTVALSGGVFANVSLNRKVAQLPGVKELHVHPGMTDSGIALGAAAHAYAQHMQRRPQALADLGLGPDFDDESVAAAFKREGYQISDTIPAETALAQALATGTVVARFVGGIEYGPRALGMRSILAPAHQRRITAELNSRLGRSQIMPFAPIARAADGPEFFHGLEKVIWPARFMATAVTCRPKMREEAEAAVHLDGTARPQLVEDNSSIATLLSEYHRRTNRKVLINTSFNLHDEPIVCRPEDAARSARLAAISVVQIGRLIATRTDGAATAPADAPPPWLETDGTA